ncbi:hypothetical protein J4212_02175 [Candidatus Woesearchaeota archaeon]|nr:hypothetical protein [Candidatus Woesearchaeota archaeon]
MGKKNKNKAKKTNPKKERYLKFRKEKNTAMILDMPDLTDEQQKEKQEAEEKLSRFFRFRPKVPPREIRERKALSKR